jgi:hypothetical protein
VDLLPQLRRQTQLKPERAVTLVRVDDAADGMEQAGQHLLEFEDS